MRSYVVLGCALVSSWAVACGGSAQTEGAAGAAGQSTVAGAAGLADAGRGGSDADAGSDGEVGGTGGDGLAGGPPIEIGPQQTSTKLDILLVVDNSVSMSDKQAAFAASLPGFLKRLINPTCLDAQGQPVATQPASAALPCTTGTRQFAPVKDLHVGVISTSLGSHGGTVCNSAENPDDRAELLPLQRGGVVSYRDTGFSAFDASGVAGDGDISKVVTEVQAAVAAAGEHGCGFEAPLEAMYRFLVDPEPPESIQLVKGVSTPTGVNTALLAQRKAFLRPDSAVAIVLLSDENDCSIRDDGVGWFVGATTTRMPRSTAACEVGANDPCCRSCAASEAAPPKGCAALSADPVCKDNPPGNYLTWDALHDSVNLRCFKQRQRFGFDLLYPVERYSNALSNPKIATRAGQLVDNPLFAARDGKGPRSASLISVSTIVGAPWQDLASTVSIGAGKNIAYLDGASLEAAGRWPVLLGTAGSDAPPSDPFMVESIMPRQGKNPLTSAAISPASSTDPRANAINGHEQNVPDLNDLQYACTFELPEPKVCANGDVACNCSADKSGDSGGVSQANSPVCQPPSGGPSGTTQYYARAYPGARELRLVQLLGARAVPASICPLTLADATSPDYAYEPAFNALAARLAATLD